MKVALVVVPFYLGREGVGMGSGPDRLLATGAVSAIRAAGHEVDVRRVAPSEPYKHEIGAVFDILTVASHEVSDAVRSGAFPLVLSGNCHTTLAVLSTLDAGRTGIVWCDAHADLNTPETTRSGFLDGMALSMAVGRSWRTMTGALPGFRPANDSSVVLVGARALDDAEVGLLGESAIRTLAVEDIRGRGARVIGDLVRQMPAAVTQLHLHVDADVLDPSVGMANEYAAPGGLTLDELLGVIGAAGHATRVVSATVAAYDPTLDHDGRMAAAGIAIIEGLVAAAAAH